MPGLNTNSMTLLRLADKLVREGDHQGALSAILKARQIDPKNQYAEAYEERVRGLMTKAPAGVQTEQSTTPPAAAPAIAASSSRLAEVAVLLDQANAAIMRNDFPGALDVIGKARMLDPTNGDITALEEQVRGACDSASPTPAEPVTNFEGVLSILDAYTSEAIDLAARGDYEEALRLVTKGFLLDPASEILHVAEREIIVARQLEESRQQASAFAVSHYHHLVEAERLRREELAHHVDCATTLLRNGALDDALTEIALGYSLDPHNEQLHDMEQAVWETKDSTGTNVESPARHQDVARLVRLHILAAEEFAKNGDFVKALDGLAKAYVIDPANIEIKRAEVRIRQSELRYHQASGSPLKLVYQYDRVVNGE
jgi:tetratricopeptide (TPR) repeat protein